MNQSKLGDPLRTADSSTIQDKFLVGYQGWFACRGDGVPVHAGHHGWLHWLDRPIPDGGRPNMDLWPDVSAYSPSELFPVPGLTLPDGKPARLFSSRHPLTVQRHFHWMAEHGIDGCFLQRFSSQIEADGNQQGARADLMRLRDEIGDRVKDAAEKEGRVYAIMYDISGAAGDQLQKLLEVDWNHLIRQRALLNSPNYLREKGRPVVAIWGVGFANNKHDPAVLRQVVRNMRNMTPGGAYVIAGTPTHWQTLQGDADSNPAFLDLYYNEFDAISPWTVGRYRDTDGADRFAEHKIRDDIQAIQQHCRRQKVDYIPVVWPGVSEHYISNRQRKPNYAPRAGGKFLWRQIFNAMSHGAKIIYGAMWDEYDEGTALMPVVPYKYNLPREAMFLALDADGYDLPPDWYMRICGLAAECLHGERRIQDTFPKKELDDYWSSRPKSVLKSAGTSASASGFSSGSGSGSGSHVTPGPYMASDTKAVSSPTSTSDPELVPCTVASELLIADQEPENEDAPPPYSLESEELPNPSPQPPHQSANTGAISPASPADLQPHPSSGSLSSGSQSHPSASAAPSLTWPAPDNQGGPSIGKMDSGKPPQPSQDTFVGGFVQRPPPNVVSPKPFPEASSSLVEGFHHYNPTTYDPPAHPHGANHPTTSTPQHQATYNSFPPPIPTHTHPSNPFPTASSNTHPHPPFPPTEWQVQNWPPSQHSPSFYYQAPALPPQHPSVASSQSTPNSLAYPHQVGTSPFNNLPQPNLYEPSPHPAHFVYSQPQYPQPLHPQMPWPMPMPANSAWGMADGTTSTELRKLERNVNSLVNETVGSVTQSMDSVIQSGKKLLRSYKVPGQR